MAKRKTKVTAKPKKKWFTVIAPEVYKKIEIADVTAFEPQLLVGRPVEVNLMQITGAPKDQHRKITFKIIDTRGEKALTEPWKSFLLESFIQRASRRFKERIVSVLKLKSKDGKPVKFKLLTLILNRLPRAIRTDLAKKIEEFMTDKISKINSADLFLSTTIDKLSSELKKELKPIYPVNKVLFWKITIF